MDLSKAFSLIRKFEGCRLKAYPDPGTGGFPWTIGYGSTVVKGKPVTKGMSCTLAQAEEWMKEDAIERASMIQTWLKTSVTPNMMAAMISLAYNIGMGAFHRSRLLLDLNNGVSPAHAAVDFMNWTHAGGHTMAGLIMRRHEEMKIFVS